VKTARVPLERTKAAERIKSTVGSRRVTLTAHLEDEMIPATVNRSDVFDAVCSGIIVGRPKWNARHRNWEYRIVATDVYGEELTIIVAYDDAQKWCHIVTVF